MSNNSTPSDNTMDFMSLLFFAVAAVWLLIAFLYTCLILVFIKVRSSGGTFLGYQHHDQHFGRIYITSRFYIPLGCLLRTYIQFFEENDDVDNESDNDNNNNNNNSNTSSSNYSLSRQIRENRRRRRMTRKERREAMEILLLRNNNNNRKETTDSFTPLSMISSIKLHFLKSTSSSSSQNNTECMKAKTEINIVNHNEVDTTESTNKDDDDDVDIIRSVSSNDEVSIETNDVSICCICLGEYIEENPTSTMLCFDADNNNSEIDTNNIIDSSLTSTKYQSICCMHHFHQDCILNWLQRPNKTDCPCCRRTLVPEVNVIKIVQQIRKEKKCKLTKSSSQKESNKTIIPQSQQQLNPSNHNISSQSFETTFEV